MDVRIASPKSLWPRDEIVSLANEIAAETGATITITDDVAEAVRGADVLLTDVWVSMGEPDEVWKERIELLMPYQINAATMAATGNPDVKFMHCLPAFHNTETEVGKEIFEKFGMDCARGDRGGLRVARVARLRRGREPAAHDQGRPGRDPRRLTMRVVAALGGNALLRRGQPLTAENQRENARAACKALAPLALEHELVISHGNGPQVGLLALQGSAYTEVEPYPLDLLGAQTEGMIGYLIQQELGNELPFEKRLASLLTLIEVDGDDPAFGDPTKPIGPIYDKADVGAARRREGLDVQARRRQLPPGRPLAAAAADLRDRAGGVAARARLRGDLRRRRRHPGHVHRRARARRAAARRRRGRDRQGPRKRTARQGSARRRAPDRHRRRRRLRGWGTPEQRAIRRATPEALAGTEFAAGSMGPKVRAACSFVEETGGIAAIGSILDTPALLRGEAGTVVTLDADGLELEAA